MYFALFPKTGSEHCISPRHILSTFSSLLLSLHLLKHPALQLQSEQPISGCAMVQRSRWLQGWVTATACQLLCTLTKTNDILMRRGYAFSLLQRAKSFALCWVGDYLEILGKWRIRWAVLKRSSKVQVFGLLSPGLDLLLI